MPWPQISGIPCARGRPGWEAPTPGRVIPGAPGSGVLLGLERVKVLEPHRDSLETSRAGTSASGGGLSKVQLQGLRTP